MCRCELGVGLIARLLVAAVVAAGVAGCNRAHVVTDNASRPGAIAPGAPSTAARRDPSFLEITIIRDPGINLKPGPYVITLRPDGTATCSGSSPAQQEGTFKAHFPPTKFTALASLIQDSGFSTFSSRELPISHTQYMIASGDAGSSTVSVLMRANVRDTVVDEAGPPPFKSNSAELLKLRRIEQSIDDAVGGDQWKLTSGDVIRAPAYEPGLTGGK